MIIRATFNDNDFTQILEAYFYKFKFCNYNLYYKNCKDLKEYVDKSIKSADLIRKITFETDKMTKEELKQFINIIKESIEEYLLVNYKTDYDYLVKHLKVSLLKSCSDKWENGEVVYYFINKDKYFTA